MISITAFGTVPTSTMVRRSGARAGDAVMVTGTIGDAALGLELRDVVTAAKRWKLEQQHSYHLMRRYLLPQPRNALAEAVRLNATAAMDVSDGLRRRSRQAVPSVRASSAEIDVARVPLSDAARERRRVGAGGDRDGADRRRRLRDRLHGAAGRGSTRSAPRRRRRACRSPRSAVSVGDKAPPRFLGRDGKPMPFKQASFSHF